MATPVPASSPHWRRHLVVCMFGSFTTIVAMTLLLPFLPLYVEQLAMFLTGTLLILATMSIEPIITVYVATLVADPAHVTLMAGVVMAAAALGSILSAARLGRLADRIGHWNVIVACLAVSALLLVPQAFVTAGWQLVLLRFLMGLSLGGLLPCIASVIRHSVPERAAGQMLGYSVSAQYTGQVLGPLLGGFVGGHVGMRAVFLGTCVLMACGAAWNAWARRAQSIEIDMPKRTSPDAKIQAHVYDRPPDRAHGTPPRLRRTDSVHRRGRLGLGHARIADRGDRSVRAGGLCGHDRRVLGRCALGACPSRRGS